MRIIVLLRGYQIRMKDRGESLIDLSDGRLMLKETTLIQDIMEVGGFVEYEEI